MERSGHHSHESCHWCMSSIVMSPMRGYNHHAAITGILHKASLCLRASYQWKRLEPKFERYVTSKPKKNWKIACKCIILKPQLLSQRLLENLPHKNTWCPKPSSPLAIQNSSLSRSIPGHDPYLIQGVWSCQLISSGAARYRHGRLGSEAAAGYHWPEAWARLMNAECNINATNSKCVRVFVQPTISERFTVPSSFTLRLKKKRTVLWLDTEFDLEFEWIWCQLQRHIPGCVMPLQNLVVWCVDAMVFQGASCITMAALEQKVSAATGSSSSKYNSAIFTYFSASKKRDAAKRHQDENRKGIPPFEAESDIEFLAIFLKNGPAQLLRQRYACPRCTPVLLSLP